MSFKEIKITDFSDNPFELVGQKWMLITAEKEDGSVNTMTASWGTMGVLWSKNVAMCVIRPQRFTKEFVDSAETFSLSFFDEIYQDDLNYLGSVSGRNEDKIAKANLTINHDSKTPYFGEARQVFICRKIFAQDITPDSFVEKDIEEWYPTQDYHTIYVGEIIKILKKD